MAMQSPYQILGVATDAGDAEIKQAYLQQVKNNPPERNPAKFQRIKQAFESIKDHKSRLRQQLFTPPTADFDSLLNGALKTSGNLQISPEQFRQLLTAGLDEAALHNALDPSDRK